MLDERRGQAIATGKMLESDEHKDNAAAYAKFK
jgi:hypothetical protein